MEIKLNITDYLSREEIKQIIIEEIRQSAAKVFKDEENIKRILSNTAYQIIFDEVEKIVPNCKGIIEEKTKSIIENFSSYSVFREGSYGTPKSLASSYVEDFVKNNKELVLEKVKDTIVNHDFSPEIWQHFEKLGSNFQDLIYEIAELGKSKINKS